MPRFPRRPGRPDPADESRGTLAAGGPAGAPTIVAELHDGPLAQRRIDAEAVEGRPPKTIDVAAPDGTVCRYCLADWAQAGHSAAYTFLYRL